MRVEEPLRSELVERMILLRQAKYPGTGSRREMIGEMLDFAATAINERLDEHAGKRVTNTATPLE